MVEVELQLLLRINLLIKTAGPIRNWHAFVTLARLLGGLLPIGQAASPATVLPIVHVAPGGHEEMSSLLANQ